MRCWRGSVAGRETKPPVSSPTMQKLEKFHAPVRGTPGVRWRVVDGASPNIARYVPAKRPQLGETETVGNLRDLDLVRVGVAQRETNFTQLTQQHILGGPMPRNSAQHNRRVRPLTTIPVAQFPQVQRPAEMFRQDLFSWHDGAWRSPRIGRWRSSNRSPTPRSDPVPWPARLRNATRSLTLSRRRDRCARVGVASAPQDAGKAAELVPLVAKRARSGESSAIPFGVHGYHVPDGRARR
jgi:hypothetical protein